MTYRHLKRVHCIRTHGVPPAMYGPRISFCGQHTYCREIPGKPGQYEDSLSTVPFVSWRKPELVTCKSCITGMRK